MAVEDNLMCAKNKWKRRKKKLLVKEKNRAVFAG